MTRPQSTQYGLPLFLEDATGSYASTSFSDLYDRAHISLSHSPAAPSRIHVRSANEVCTIDLPSSSDPSGGSVTYSSPGSPPSTIPVDVYLRKVKGASSRSPARRFTASDANAYTWTFTQSNPKDKSTAAWACTNAQGAVVAEYTLNDQNVTGSSNFAALLTVEEAWNAIAVEILTTLVLVRHLATLKC